MRGKDRYNHHLVYASRHVLPPSVKDITSLSDEIFFLFFFSSLLKECLESCVHACMCILS